MSVPCGIDLSHVSTHQIEFETMKGLVDLSNSERITYTNLTVWDLKLHAQTAHTVVGG